MEYKFYQMLTNETLALPNVYQQNHDLTKTKNLLYSIPMEPLFFQMLTNRITILPYTNQQNNNPTKS